MVIQPGTRISVNAWVQTREGRTQRRPVTLSDDGRISFSASAVFSPTPPMELVEQLTDAVLDAIPAAELLVPATRERVRKAAAAMHRTLTIRTVSETA